MKLGSRVSTNHGDGILIAIDADDFGYKRYHVVKLDRGFTVVVTQISLIK